MRIFQRQQKCQRDQRAYTLDLFQQRHLGIALLRQGFDALVALGDTFAHRFDGRQQRLQCPLQLRTQAFGFFRIHVAHVAATQAFAVALGQPTGCVSQRRPGSYQSRSRSDHHQIRLCLRTAMLHRTEQLWIDPGQSCQPLCIETIVFLAARPDQPHIAGVRYDHFVSHLAEQATDPGRMRPGLQCNPAARHFRESFAQCFLCRTYSLLYLYLARFVQHAIPTVAVSQIQTNRQFLLRYIPALLCLCSATLFHCRSPFICASSTSITWERTASRLETGLLISSVMIASTPCGSSSVNFSTVITSTTHTFAFTAFRDCATDQPSVSTKKD